MELRYYAEENKGVTTYHLKFGDSELSLTDTLKDTPGALGGIASGAYNLDPKTVEIINQPISSTPSYRPLNKAEERQLLRA